MASRIPSRIQAVPTIQTCAMPCVAAMVIAVAAACGGSNGSGSFAEGSCVLPTPQPCAGCIEYALEARLVSGPGTDDSIAANTLAGYLARDGHGRYWLGQHDHLKVFDSSGALLGRVGRRGQGPLEFQSAHPIAVDSLGQVHILDNLGGRVLVVGIDLELMEEHRVPVFTDEMVLMPETGAYALSAWIPDAMSAGYPIHVLEAGKFTRSIGVMTDSLPYRMPLQPFDVQRKLAIGDSDAVFAARPWDYLVDAWDVSGRRLGLMMGPPLTDGLRGAPGPYSKSNPPWNGIWDIRFDGSGLMWTLLNIRRPDWDTRVAEIVERDGSVHLQGRSVDMYRSRVDVVDVQSCAVVSSSWFDGEGVLSSFLHSDATRVDGMLVEEVVRSDFADPIVNVWHASLR